MENFFNLLFGGCGFAFLSGLLYLWYKVGKYQNIVDSLKSTQETVLKDIKNITTQLSELKGGIDRDRAHYGGFVQGRSPLTLTEKGESALNESGGKDYIDKNKQCFLNEIKLGNPKSSYDIQELSKKVLNDHQNDDTFIGIKEYTYKNGLLLDHVIMALSIYLRDYALNELGFKSDETT